MKNSFKQSIVLTTLLLLGGMLPLMGLSQVQASELLEESAEIVKAEVQSIEKTTYEQLGWEEGVLTTVQYLDVLILDGEQAGEVISIQNEGRELKEEDSVYVKHTVDLTGFERYQIYERDRASELLLIVGLFILLLLVFGKMKGLRALLGLVGSLFVIVFVLVPAILAGYNPVLISIIVASTILCFALFFTHGFNRGSFVALGGTISAVCITGLLAYFAIEATHLSGMTEETHTYLRLNSGGTLDFVGLLLGAIIIGALGALDDIAVTQVAVVRELFIANKDLSRMEVYHKAMRVGREHVGALVNTLVLAYVGTALPILLLYAQASEGGIPFFNLEIFATEIIRTIVGSIGLVLAVPITTLLAVYFIKNAQSLKGFEHSHSH
jgi:uncharacterized membrane protein